MFSQDFQRERQPYRLQRRRLREVRENPADPEMTHIIYKERLYGNYYADNEIERVYLFFHFLTIEFDSYENLSVGEIFQNARSTCRS